MDPWNLCFLMSFDLAKERLRGMRGLQSAWRVYQAARFLYGPSDVYRYWRLHTGTVERNAGPVKMRVRALGGGVVLCRPGTSDARVLYDTFHGLFHLPAEPLPFDAFVLDLGANVGYTAAQFAVLAPRGRIIAVEMDRGNAELAAANLKRFGARCTVIHAAVWNVNTEVTYEAGEEDEYRVGVSATGTTVKAEMVDTILGTLGLEKQPIDYVKMDIEGAESTVLPHAGPWLDRTRAISVEVHPPVTVGECAAWLVARGFACRPHPDHWSAVIAVRP